MFGKKPDHPLFSLAEARQKVADLPQDDTKKSLEEITFWLDTIKNAEGFTPALRAEIVLFLDEAGRSLQSELLHRYLDASTLRNYQVMHLWQAAHVFLIALSETYSACLGEIQRAEKIPTDFHDKIPLVCVRMLHATCNQLKLELMRYTEIDLTVWERMWSCYRFAELRRLTDSAVLAYTGQVAQTSAKRELLRALLLYTSSPGTLSPDQIELSYRITGYLSGNFRLSKVLDEACPYMFDLQVNLPPNKVELAATHQPDVRYFGAIDALPALAKIIAQSESGPLLTEKRFGIEFTSELKLTVLKHLMRYWSPERPKRVAERRDINAAVEVAHGFRLISKLITRLSLTNIGGQADSSTEVLNLNIETDDEEMHATEVWSISDMSTGGIRAVLSGNLGAWIKIGQLCALKPQKGNRWWVGIIRRLSTDGEKKVHVGIQLITKSPASLWLRVLGRGAEREFNWKTDSGLFAYEYLPVILLPDADNSYLRANMLMEPGNFAKDAIFQTMLDESGKSIRVSKLLGVGEDYEMVKFEWLD